MQKTVYAPTGKSIIKNGKNIHNARYMLTEIIAARELTLRWFLRDFNAQYRQTALGFLWALIAPIFTVLIFVLMRNSGVINAGDTQVPYPVFALCGLTFWSIFSAGITKASVSLINAGALMIKINFPKISIVLASSLLGLADFIIKFIILIFAMLVFGVKFSIAGLIMATISLLPLYFLTLGLGMILSIISGVLRDTVNFLNLILMPFMLVTPVLYVPDPNSFLYLLNRYNPLNHLVNFPRNILFYDSSINTPEFIISSIFSILILLFGWRLFYLAQTKITERI